MSLRLTRGRALAMAAVFAPLPWLAGFAGFLFIGHAPLPDEGYADFWRYLLLLFGIYVSLVTYGAVAGGLFALPALMWFARHGITGLAPHLGIAALAFALPAVPFRNLQLIALAIPGGLAAALIYWYTARPDLPSPDAA